MGCECDWTRCVSRKGVKRSHTTVLFESEVESHHDCLRSALMVSSAEETVMQS